MRNADMLSFSTHDGVDLTYRHWPAEQTSERARGAMGCLRVNAALRWLDLPL